MIPTQTTERQTLHRLIDNLPDDEAEKVLSFVEFLNYMQAKEDEEDIAAYLARKDEPTYSLDEVKRELDLP